MSVIFFQDGITVGDEAAARADVFCSDEWLSKYVREFGDTPPGWPNPSGHKALIEWTIYSLFRDALNDYEHRMYNEAYVPSGWEGPQ